MLRIEFLTDDDNQTLIGCGLSPVVPRVGEKVLLHGKRGTIKVITVSSVEYTMLDIEQFGTKCIDRPSVIVLGKVGA